MTTAIEGALPPMRDVKKRKKNLELMSAVILSGLMGPRNWPDKEMIDRSVQAAINIRSRVDKLP